MRYFGGWKDRESMARDFEAGTWKDQRARGPDAEFTVYADFPPEEDILFASYGGEMYEGDAVVIFQRDGKLFEVRGSHCSCYGLEGQWEPEETDLLTLQKRNEDNKFSWHFLSSHDATALDFAAALVDLV